MAIEQLIEKLIASLDANTAAHLGKPATTAGKSGDKETPAKPAAKKQADKADDEVTQEVMKAALTKVKEELDTDTAKGIIKKVAKVDALKDIPEDKYAAIVKACEKTLADAANSSTSGDDDDGL